jgi:hypothetical protein
MFKRWAGYVILMGFAAVMVVMLMVNDPAHKQAEVFNQRATQQASLPIQLFPVVRDPAQITGIEVLDVTTGKGILMVREDSGLWYVPEIPDIQTAVPADEVDQNLTEQAAQSLADMVANKKYSVNASGLGQYGLEPRSSYEIRFRATDGEQEIEPVIEIGALNPDHVAYYGYVYFKSDETLPTDTELTIYLIPISVVDPVLTMLPETVPFAPTLTAPALENEATAVP